MMNNDLPSASPSTASDGDYERWILSIKERVRHARLRALLAANAEQLALYWDIGRSILDKQEEHGWGSKVVDRMSRDLRAEFPDMTGFSLRNLLYMRAFAETWRRSEIVQAPLAQLPWYHQIALLEHLKSRSDRLAYAEQAAANGWSRNVLVHNIDLRTVPPSPRAISRFRPQDAGQLGFYMTAVDRQVKTPSDGKTVGLLLCKSRNRVVVEYALADLLHPIGVSTYDLGLPPPDQLGAQLERALRAQ